MENKMKSLKISGKVISILMRICYIMTIIMMGLCAAVLIFMAATGGKTSIATSGGMNIVVAETTASPGALAAMCAELFIMSAFLFVIFLLIYRMFHEISVEGAPFSAKNVKRIRAVGILTAAMTVVIGIADAVLSPYAGAEAPDLYSRMPGVAVGAVIFCLSYIFDYGCGLQEKADKAD